MCIRDRYQRRVHGECFITPQPAKFQRSHLLTQMIAGNGVSLAKPNPQRFVFDHLDLESDRCPFIQLRCESNPEFFETFKMPNDIEFAYVKLVITLANLEEDLQALVSSNRTLVRHNSLAETGSGLRPLESICELINWNLQELDTSRQQITGLEVLLRRSENETRQRIRVEEELKVLIEILRSRMSELEREASKLQKALQDTMDTLLLVRTDANVKIKALEEELERRNSPKLQMMPVTSRFPMSRRQLEERNPAETTRSIEKSKSKEGGLTLKVVDLKSLVKSVRQKVVGSSKERKSGPTRLRTLHTASSRELSVMNSIENETSLRKLFSKRKEPKNVSISVNPQK
eukprot:TRINITY_DN5828_c0_g3_i1.p1 TRINITY_DN5828_c0_g3~~TRINITY_DN5828_c0_g3_i1.p1  ORF type:complete len:346 (+),score=37.80 TRINITY_DN5828_c0_g3_i1:3-1040(+)